MDSTCEYRASIADAPPGHGPFPRSEYAFVASRRQPHPKLSLMRELRIGIAGALLGIGIHVVYLFVLVLMPYQSTGAAEFGQRFSDLW